jgi:hypothetical protein
MHKIITISILLFLSFQINAQDCATPLDTPFSDDFQNGSAFSSCWITENTDNANPIWTINSSTDINQDGTVDNFATIFATNSSQTEKNDWLFSPLISFSAGTNYIVNVKFNTFNLGNVTANQSFSLYLVDAASSTATTQISLGNYNNILQNGQNQVSNGNDLIAQAYNTFANFNPTSSGNYRVAIHANQSGNACPLFIFSITVESSNVATSASFNTENISHFYNSITSSLEINTKNSEINSVQIYNSIGQIVNQNSAKKASLNIDMSKNEIGLYIAKIQFDDKIKTIKFIKN